MKTSIKVGTALGIVLLACIGLEAVGVLPDPFRARYAEGEPVAVSFRPLVREPVGEARPGLAEGPAATERRLLPAAAVTERAAAAEARSVGAIEAVLVDGDGRALVGAQLREVAEAGPGAAAASGAAGRARLELELEPGTTERRVRIEAFEPGFASHSELVRALPGRTVQLGTIRLLPGGVVSGRAVDAGGRGIAGAAVSSFGFEVSARELDLGRFSPGFEHARRNSLPRTVTDEAGTFVLAGLGEGFHRLWVQADGWMPTFTTPVEVRAAQESFGVEVTLKPIADENRVHGVVVDPAGDPIAFARLRIDHGSKECAMTVKGIETEAEADGTFALLVFHDARVWITASDPLDRYGPANAEGVRTGAAPLVLQLAEIPLTTLRVIGAEGEPLERFGFEVLSTDEDFRQAEHPRSEHPGGVASLRVPDREFLLRVGAPLHRTESFGPFDPAAIGDLVEVRLESVPGLAGVTLAAEGPVAGARVELFPTLRTGMSCDKNGFRCRFDPQPVDEARSDAEGRFHLTVQEPGEYHVRAAKEGLAAAEVGPIAVGSDLTAPPIELRLGQGGAIEGRVIAPAGEEPTGTIVGISRGDGYARTERVGPDGAYRFTQLTPGPWLVEVRDEEVFSGRSTLTTSRGPRERAEEAIEWTCTVHEGETTFLDLRLADEDAHRVEGTLTIDGDWPAGWIAWICPASNEDFFDFDEAFSSAYLDTGGHFEVGVPEPRDYLLVIKYATTGREVAFVDRVQVAAEVTPWSLEVRTGELVVEGVEAAIEGDEDIPEFLYLWEGPGELWFVGLLMPDEGGVARLGPVPSGTGRLVRPSLEAILDPGSWEVAREFQVARGKETRIDAP